MTSYPQCGSSPQLFVAWFISKTENRSYDALHFNMPMATCILEKAVILQKGTIWLKTSFVAIPFL